MKMKSLLPLILSVSFCIGGWSSNAEASREVMFQSYPPPLPNNERPNPNQAETLVSGYEVQIFLSNPSSIQQTGTVEVSKAQSNISVGFTQTTATGYIFLDPNFLSWICGGTGGTEAFVTGTSQIPNWPTGQTFKIPPKGAVLVSLGTLFYKALAAGDKVTKSNGRFIPTITLKVNEDKGAIFGYSLAMNRAFSTAAYTICAGASSMPTSPTLVSQWLYHPSTPKELNGGRPF